MIIPHKPRVTPETKAISLILGIFSEVRRRKIHPQRPTGSRSTSIGQVENHRRLIPVCSCGWDIFVQVVIWWFDQAGVRAGRTKEREISVAHHFTWRPRPVTFWADCTAARSGTVRLPLQSASYCNTPPHLCPSRISPFPPSPPLSLSFPSVPPSPSSFPPFFLPLFFRLFLRSASSRILCEIYLRRPLSSSLWRCPSGLRRRGAACSSSPRDVARCQRENHLPLFMQTL